MTLLAIAMASLAFVTSISALMQSLENRRRLDDSQTIRRLTESRRLNGQHTYDGPR